MIQCKWEGTDTSNYMLHSLPHLQSTLCRYHSTHVLVIPGTIPEPVPPLQSAVLSFLHNVLVSKPTTGHALIQSLTAKESPAYLANNEALQLLYVKAIHESLEAMLQLKLPSEVPETDSDSQYESDHTLTAVIQGRQGVTKECQRLTTLIYGLLSLMDPRPEMSHVLVDKLFVFLLKMNHQLGPEKFIRFDVSKIYACLVGRSTPYLVQRLHEVEEYVRVKASSVGGGAADKSGAWSLKLLRQTEGAQDWRALFFHVYHDHKHFLECVLVGLCVCVCLCVERDRMKEWVFDFPRIAICHQAMTLPGLGCAKNQTLTSRKCHKTTTCSRCHKLTICSPHETHRECMYVCVCLCVI